MSFCERILTDVKLIRLWLKAVTWTIAGVRRQNGNRPAVTGLFAIRLPSTASPCKSQTQSARRRTGLRYHHCRISHPETRRRISPVVKHLGDEHRNRNHRANNQYEIMR